MSNTMQDTEILEIATKDEDKFRKIIFDMPEDQARIILDNFKKIGIKVPPDITGYFEEPPKSKIIKFFTQWNWKKALLWLLICAAIRFIILFTQSWISNSQ